jgi:nucleoside-triphosphatase
LAEHRSPKPGVAGSIPVSPASTASTATPVKILLTGHPGSGKTTSVREVVERLRGRVPMTGFITEELRESGRRVGFQGVTLDGRTFALAHVRTGGSLRIGPYGVDLAGLESIGLDALTPHQPGVVVVLDEIGKMECLSEAFKTRVAQLLEDDTPLIATVAAVGVGFVKRVRNTAHAKHFTMTRGESEGMAGEIARVVTGAMRVGAARTP